MPLSSSLDQQLSHHHVQNTSDAHFNNKMGLVEAVAARIGQLSESVHQTSSANLILPEAPRFPSLCAPKMILTPSKVTTTPYNDVHVRDIAEEALRLTRETLQTNGLTGLQGSVTPSSPNMSNMKVQPNIHSCDYRSQNTLTATSLQLPPKKPSTTTSTTDARSGLRLNKFVRRLHDMLMAEKDSGIVEWRRGLLVLHNTEAFVAKILSKYFNTRNFKTFRRQLNYYGFVHVRSFSNTSSTTTALWVNRALAEANRSSSDTDEDTNNSIASVLLLKRVEPCEAAKTAEGRRVRKELALSTVQDDLGGVICCGSSVGLKVPSTQVPCEISVQQPLCGSVSSSSDDDSNKHNTKPMSSNVSAANLLLLLSKV